MKTLPQVAEGTPTHCFFCRREIKFGGNRRAFRVTMTGTEILRAHFGCVDTFIKQAEMSHATQASPTA